MPRECNVNAMLRPCTTLVSRQSNDDGISVHTAAPAPMIATCMAEFGGCVTTGGESKLLAAELSSNCVTNAVVVKGGKISYRKMYYVKKKKKNKDRYGKERKLVSAGRCFLLSFLLKFCMMMVVIRSYEEGVELLVVPRTKSMLAPNQVARKRFHKE